MIVERSAVRLHTDAGQGCGFTNFACSGDGSDRVRRLANRAARWGHPTALDTADGFLDQPRPVDGNGMSLAGPLAMTLVVASAGGMKAVPPLHQRAPEQWHLGGAQTAFPSAAHQRGPTPLMRQRRLGRFRLAVRRS